MRWSQTYIPTLREAPSEAEIPSHALLLRAGFIKRLAAGVYSYLPLGFRSLNKTIQIVREEMDRAGACEVLMPAIHPEEIWAEGPRLDAMKEIMMRFKDRAGRDMVLGPTHEEIVTDLVRNGINSYRQLPFTLYQIQSKFRDEPRPRSGILRSREFIMKDAYSFDPDWDSLDRSYRTMYDAYCRIFKRCGLDYTIVEADSGVMGGSASSEFMVECDNGEDTLVSCRSCGYAANMEKAVCAAPEPLSEESMLSLEEMHTPGMTTIEQVSDFLDTFPENLLKTLIYIADGEPVAVLVRGDHTLNEAKLAGYLKTEPVMADEETILKVTGGPVGFSGPAGLKMRIIADRYASGLPNMITGGNKADTHLRNVNPERDYQISETVDLRNVQKLDKCERCSVDLTISRGIEIGHVFKLGTKYSEAMNAVFLNEEGAEQPMIMGCYGIGVNRIMASAAEKSLDDKGLVWPLAIAPYRVHLIPTNYTDEDIRTAADKIYTELTNLGIDVLLDDRDARAGVKFNDADLIGIPLRITIGPKGLKENSVELKWRHEQNSELCPVNECSYRVASMVS